MTASQEPEQEPGPALAALPDLFARLRAECPWKAAQTHHSLVRYLLEETAEVVEAVESLPTSPSGARAEAADDELRDELGDLLLQVHLHAAIAAEEGRFDIEDVAAGLREKMLRRNPHVFGPAQGATGGAADGAEELEPAEVDRRWQEIKATERPRDRVLDGVPEGLSSVLRAVKLVERTARGPRPLRADASSADVGERMLALVAEAVGAGTDPDQALREAVRRHAAGHDDPRS